VNIETIIVPVASVPIKHIYPSDIVAACIQDIDDSRGVLFSLLGSIWKIRAGGRDRGCGEDAIKTGYEDKLRSV